MYVDVYYVSHFMKLVSHYSLFTLLVFYLRSILDIFPCECVSFLILSLCYNLSLISEHLDCFPIFAIKNNAAINNLYICHLYLQVYLHM